MDHNIAYNIGELLGQYMGWSLFFLLLWYLDDRSRRRKNAKKDE
jgi:hypothetical protein